MTLHAGTRVGPYQIVSALGAGGMGEVYRATDTNLGRQVAIKVLPEALAADAERLARFDREAKMLAAVSHPNIAAIYSLERTPGTTALVMELVEGPTLADRIAQGALPLDDALGIARQIAAALAAAHDQGIVHRDLKPANIKLRADGTVKVLDFGLAKLNDPNAPNDKNGPNALSLSPTITSPALVTGVGTLLGTAAYMSPEQARGKVVDKRSDIWAFGVVVYEMLTGGPLFAGETVTDVLAAVVTRTPDLALVPASTRRLLDACLQKDPARRLRDIADFELLLDSTTAGAATGQARPWIPWTAAAALAVVAAGLGALYLRRPERPAAPPIQFEIPLPPDAAGRPLISPDGTMLVYHGSGSDGRPELRLRRLDSLESTPLAGTGMTLRTEPIWSHDSRYVAFWAGDGALKRVLLPDGPVDTIADIGEPMGGSWNAEGVLILGSRSGGLRRVSTTDGGVSDITTLDRSKGDAADRNPSFWPDGRRFTFYRLSGDPARNGIWLGSLDASDPPGKLLDARAASFAGDLPGIGPTMLFLREDRVFAQRIDLDRLALSGDPQPVAGVAGIGGSASLTGVLVLATNPARQLTRLTWYDRRGNATAAENDTDATNTIDLSPDGGRLSVARAGDSGQVDMWIRDLARGSATRLNRRGAYSGLWSPSGSHIVFNEPRDGIATILRAPSNGTGEPELLLKLPRDAWANDVSADGRVLLFSSPSADSDLDVGYLALDGPQRAPQPYLAESFTQKQAQFSPDGKFVAYISDESGRFEVYVRTFPDPNLGKWPISANGGVEPRWGPDGRELFFWSGRSLHVVDVKTTPAFDVSPARKLFDAPIQPGYTNDGHRWQVSPDGQRFLVLALQESAPGTVRVIVNWPSLLQRGQDTD
jgi:serine/threonine protein kinase/WD40 repeat protein